MHPSNRGLHSSLLDLFDDLNTSSTDEDYIDMEVNSTTFLRHSFNSSPEFEFNMSVQEDSLTSPADELFYKGNLLPLHLPPRIQMVRKLLHSCNQEKTSPLSSQGANPYESCSVSPSESCQISGELSPDEYFYDCNTNLGGTGDGADVTSSSFCAKKAWCKKVKLIKQLTFASKLKASKAYFRYLFGKSGCSEGSCTSAVKNNTKCRKEGSLLRIENSAQKAVKDCLKSKCPKVTKRNPFGQIYKESRKASIKKDEGHRKSFSGAIKGLSFSGVKSLSSPLLSSTRETDGYNGMHLLKRSSSVNSDVERSIQGAIAYCKQSQLLCPRRSASDVGIFSFDCCFKSGGL